MVSEDVFECFAFTTKDSIAPEVLGQPWQCICREKRMSADSNMWGAFAWELK
jgi:hypothetical protein